MQQSLVTQRTSDYLTSPSPLPAYAFKSSRASEKAHIDRMSAYLREFDAKMAGKWLNSLQLNEKPPHKGIIEKTMAHKLKGRVYGKFCIQYG